MPQRASKMILADALAHLSGGDRRLTLEQVTLGALWGKENSPRKHTLCWGRGLCTCESELPQHDSVQTCPGSRASNADKSVPSETSACSCSVCSRACPRCLSGLAVSYNRRRGPRKVRFQLCYLTPSNGRTVHPARVFFDLSSTEGLLVGRLHPSGWQPVPSLVLELRECVVCVSAWRGEALCGRRGLVVRWERSVSVQPLIRVPILVLGKSVQSKPVNSGNWNQAL